MPERKKPGRKKKDTPVSLDPPMLPTCLDMPPYPTGAGPGCIFWGDGEHGHWSDPPVNGSTAVWNAEANEWQMTNPAAAPKPNGDKPPDLQPVM